MNTTEIFEAVLNKIEKDANIKALTNKAVLNTKVYKENLSAVENSIFNKDCTIRVEQCLTLSATRQLIEKYKKVAVLNFANPINPGGGVTIGANAQEEYLCRTTNLYYCLLSAEAKENYYDYHKILKVSSLLRDGFVASNRTIYSPSVTVLFEEKDEFIGVNQNKFIDKPYYVDVITCAAPCLWEMTKEQREPVNLSKLFASRISNILETAICNKVEALVLGAFGCGVFGNSPELVANAFHTVLNQKRYIKAFKEIVFAIKVSSAGANNNYQMFKKIFSKDVN